MSFRRDAAHVRQTDRCYTIPSHVVRFLTLSLFECVFVPSQVVRYLTLPPFERAFEPSPLR